MACIAFAFLQHLRLAEHRRTGPGEDAPPRSGTATITKPARHTPGRHGPAARPTRPARPVPLLPKLVPTILRPDNAQVVLDVMLTTSREAWLDRRRLQAPLKALGPS